jgi:hypothetical protein
MSEGIIIALIGLAGVILNVVILRRQGKSEKAQQDAAERMAIILECSEASLIGVKQLGANGRVTKCLESLEEYKNKKAAV